MLEDFLDSVQQSIFADYDGKKQGYLRVPETQYNLPFTLIKGASSGKNLLITAGIHSCEYVSIEAALRLSRQLKPSLVHGSVLILPIMNISGFQSRQTTVVPEDMKNLNRVFSGDPKGSNSEKIAAFLSGGIFPHIDFYADLHCVCQFEELVPHLYFYGDKAQNSSAEASKYINVPFAVRSSSTNSACGCAANLGIPSLLIERGGNGIWSESQVSDMLSDIYNLMRYLGILDGEAKLFSPKELTGCKFIDDFPAGLWYPEKSSGSYFKKGESLGFIRDAFGGVIKNYIAPYDGAVLYQTASLWADSFCDLIAFGKTD
ncbi:MAG: succinylglutamate desuccinylase [Clostridiales bacterium]|nr:succinylglutamate desuccinylase [Clostridiales bacterium]